MAKTTYRAQPGRTVPIPLHLRSSPTGAPFSLPPGEEIELESTDQLVIRMVGRGDLKAVDKPRRAELSPASTPPPMKREE